jgi:hypothetical protein
MKKKTKEWLLAGPRIALSPDGEVILYDEKGKEIELGKGRPTEDFIKAVQGKELEGVGTITLFGYRGKTVCERWYNILGVWYCFLVDCTTGAYIGRCYGPGPN